LAFVVKLLNAQKIHNANVRATLTGEREEIMNFPLLIKQTRIALGETQAEFAERFATQANTVSRWESGQYQASYECLSFVVGYARDLVWSACPHCNGTGRVKSTLGKEAHKALNTKTS
jgi:DNA-binding transcriptional regulator YiaG